MKFCTNMYLDNL